MLGLSLLAVATLGASAASAADSPSGRLVLTLEGALAQNYKKAEPADPKPLDVCATCTDGRWEDVWASAQTFNRSIHDGRIVSAEITADRVRVKVALAIRSDPWIKGGPAEYQVDLKRQGEALEGTFSGTFAGPFDVFEAKGRAHGLLLPPKPVAEGFVPVKPGEHPRLLFRPADLPALRQRMKTPLGKAIVERLGRRSDPIALGVMYQLTGDRAYAERAFPATDKAMADRNQGPFALGRAWGYKTTVIGLAYDLCHDAWTPEQREKTENYFDDILSMCLNRKNLLRSVNWQPGSNYTVVIHGGNGMAALALWGEKEPEPAEPLAPLTEAPHIAPPADYQPGRGVPVVAMPVGKMPEEWLWLGPFSLHYASGLDCLASAGGMAKVRPQEGEEVKFRSQTCRWQPLSPKTNPGMFRTEGYRVPSGMRVLDTPKLAGREQTRLFFYTVVENDKPGWYKFQANVWSGRCYLAGQRLDDGDLCRLDKGRYPLLVPVIIGQPTGQAFPFFVEATEDEAGKWYADPKRAEAYAKAKQAWQADLDAWKDAGGTSRKFLDYATRLRHWNYLNLRLGMGDGGFQGEGEGYTLECHHVPHDYACTYRTVFGTSVTGLPDISHFVPRYVMTTVWRPQGRGRERPLNQTYGRGSGTADTKYLCRAIALCPEPWKPALLWFWLKHLGVSAADMQTDAGVAKALEQGRFEDTLALVWTFLNYPLDLEPRNPGEVMPRVWEARTRGFYAFRDGWKGADSIVAQIYAKAGQSCGWNQAEAGCFQIYGLGHEWAWKESEGGYGKTGSRWYDNVVMLPEDPVNAWGPGRVTHFRGDEKTGAGVVTIDMSEVYQCMGKVKDAAGKQRDGWVDAGIRGLRSFAADYSGKAGTPGLFAVVDKITGGKKKVWVYQLPKSGRDGPDIQCAIDGNTFTLTAADASLKATVVAPAGARVTKAAGAGAPKASNVPDARFPALHVTGPDGKAGDFFVVMTLQRGDTPQVKTSGSGLDAKVTVGGQTVRFDGEKIVVGP